MELCRVASRRKINDFAGSTQETTLSAFPDHPRHLSARHSFQLGMNAEGIFMAETIFGHTLTLSTGRVIPTRWVGEQHVREDLGFIPSFADWVKAIRPEPWMGRAQKLEDSLEAGNPPDLTSLDPLMTKKQTASPVDAAKIPRWMQNIRDFDALEIHPCVGVGTDSLDNLIVEQCEPEDAHFWSVFGHLRTGGTDDFEDFATEAEAIAFHDRLLAAYPHLGQRARLEDPPSLPPTAAKGDPHASAF
jgi:hypothetical protein